MFFSSADQLGDNDKYRLLKSTARYADTHGFTAIWTPERHFHEFGGLFPNPALTGAALAMITENVQIRAGSLITPLHDPLRVAEEWSVVDNLSGGRVAVSFGSGWNANDFAFFPKRYGARSEIVYEHIDIVQRLWRGGVVERLNGAGQAIEIKIFPRPVQKTLPVWITTSGNPESFVRIGNQGVNLLTHLLGQDIGSLAGHIDQYRNACGLAGFDRNHGIVSLMLHTFVGLDIQSVRQKVRTPLREYLRSAVRLEKQSAGAGGKISGNVEASGEPIVDQDLEELLDLAFERYFQNSGLLGTPETCIRFLQKLQRAGVDEVACLIDFGLEHDAVMRSLELLTEVRNELARTSAGRIKDRVAAFNEVLQ